MIGEGRLRLLMDRYNSLSMRERLGVTGATAVVLFFLISVSMLAPDNIRRKQATAKLAAQKSEIAAVGMKMGVASDQLANDPVARQLAERDELRKVLAEAEAELSKVDQTALNMGALVREILAASPGVSLVSIRTLPVSTIIQAKAAPASPPPGGKAGPVDAAPPVSIYQHGVEVNLKGNYLAMLPYLEKLQKSSSRLFWLDASVEVAEYPEAKVKLFIYSLSGQRIPSLG